MMQRCAIVLACLLLVACDIDNGLKGSGVVKTEVRQVGKFTAIQLSDTGRLVIERTGTEGLSVTADDNYLPLLKSEVKNDTLYLSVADGQRLAKQPTYTITVAGLRSIDIQGAGEIEATKLDGDALTISVSGAASGTVAGRADDLTITISGAAKFDAGPLQAKRATVVVSARVR